MTFKIKFKPSFFVLAAFSFIMGAEKYFITVLVLTALHELCHVFAAGLWGLKTKSITITPIGMYSEIDGLNGLHISKRMFIAIAGPLFNLFLCLFCTGTARNINLVLALFNLLPIYPLDGGKLLCDAVGYFFGTMRGNSFSVRVGRLLSVSVISAGVLQLVLYPPNISLLCLGIYLYKHNKLCMVRLTYDLLNTLLYKKNDRILPVRQISVGEETDIKTVFGRLDNDHFTMVHIRGKGSALLMEERITDHIMKNGLFGKIKEL